MAQTTTRRTVHSHTRLERIRRRLFADPPWSAIPDGQHLRFAVSKGIRQAWLWRDISPGPLTASALWLILGCPTSQTAFTWLLGLCGALSVAAVWFDSDHGHTANKDRSEYRLVMRFKRAWLDATATMTDRVRPSIPDIVWTSDRDHATTLAVSLVAGDDEYAVARKVRAALSVAYSKPVIFDPQGDGTALIVVRKSDPLAVEPELRLRGVPVVVDERADHVPLAGREVVHLEQGRIRREEIRRRWVAHPGDSLAADDGIPVELLILGQGRRHAGREIVDADVEL